MKEINLFESGVLTSRPRGRLLDAAQPRLSVTPALSAALAPPSPLFLLPLARRVRPSPLICCAAPVSQRRPLCAARAAQRRTRRRPLEFR
ncbi:hypothetical protein E2C01_037633 [Portunus trituberculatus]|uniref:Uncharacterized protein n=1 Tax=Portunus trituberculatus TaxID=210409 RepID=A0A5B7FHJ7_PORTR|nr:hypothetical protein [Portunus trituberculatus]